MKKIILLVFACIFLIAGCGNDEYTMEKQYWLVQKQAEKIFKNPEATPSNELNQVVDSLGKFSKRYPKSVLSLEAQFNIARLYILKREYEKAREYLKAMLVQHGKSEPICSEVLFLMGNSYEIQDKWNHALEEYNNIIRNYPLTLRGLSTPIYIAQHYKIKYKPDMMMDAYKEAGRHYKALIDKYPDSGLAFTAYQLLAQCYMENKDWQNVIATFDAILEKFKGEKYKGKVSLDVILMNKAAIYLSQLKEQEKAKEILSQVISEYPQSRYVNLAKDLLRRLLVPGK